MSWVKLDDQFLRHPKIVAAGRDARDLYIAGLCYCASGLTDGRIPANALRILGADADIDDARQAAETLVAQELWSVTDAGYAVHDYHDYNPTRERVLETRQARAEAGSRGGKQKASKLPARGYDGASDMSLANGKQNSAPSPSPSPSPSPDPDPGGSPPASPGPPGADAPTTPAKPARTRRKPDTPMPVDFELRGELLAFAAGEGLSEAAARHEFAKFRSHAQATDRRQVDWSASWRTWVLKSLDDGAGRGRTGPPVAIRGSTAGHAERAHAAAEEAKALLRGQRRRDDEAIETTGRVGT